MPERFHSGWNFAGQEPIEDPACHSLYQDAAASLAEMIRDYAHSSDEAAYDLADPDAYESDEEYWTSDDAPKMAATVGAILRDDGPREPNDFEAVAVNHLDRTVLFWLRKVICEDPDHLGFEMPGFDDLHIEADVAHAEMTRSQLSTWTAARIASQLHDGQWSAMYELASSGSIDFDRLIPEIAATIRDPHLDSAAKNWAIQLVKWLATKDQMRRPAAGWRERTADSQAPFLGRIATSVTPA